MTKIEIAIVFWFVCSLMWLSANLITDSSARIKPNKKPFIFIIDIIVSPITILLTIPIVFVAFFQILTKERSWRKSE